MNQEAEKNMENIFSEVQEKLEKEMDKYFPDQFLLDFQIRENFIVDVFTIPINEKEIFLRKYAGKTVDIDALVLDDEIHPIVYNIKPDENKDKIIITINSFEYLSEDQEEDLLDGVKEFLLILLQAVLNQVDEDMKNIKG